MNESPYPPFAPRGRDHRAETSAPECFHSDRRDCEPRRFGILPRVAGMKITGVCTC